VAVALAGTLGLGVAFAQSVRETAPTVATSGQPSTPLLDAAPTADREIGGENAEPLPPAVPQAAEARADASAAHRYPTPVARLEQRFRNESRDPTTAVILETEILNRIASTPNPALLGVDVECHATICRVRMVGQPSLRPAAADPPARNNLLDGFKAYPVGPRPAANAAGIIATEWLFERQAEPN